MRIRGTTTTSESTAFTLPCGGAIPFATWTHSARRTDRSGSSTWSSSILCATEVLYECLLLISDDPAGAGAGNLDDRK